jgi:hypothetical protein
MYNHHVRPENWPECSTWFHKPHFKSWRSRDGLTNEGAAFPSPDAYHSLFKFHGVRMTPSWSAIRDDTIGVSKLTPKRVNSDTILTPWWCRPYSTGWLLVGLLRAIGWVRKVLGAIARQGMSYIIILWGATPFMIALETHVSPASPHSNTFLLIYSW